MDYEIRHGNPHDPNRLPEEQATYAALDALGIEYDRVDHAPAFTIEACAGVDRALGFAICKNLFLRTRNGSAYYLLLMPGDKPFKTKELSAQIGASRLSFGEAEEMREMLHLTPGSVTVFGLAYDAAGRVTLLIDRDLLESEYFGGHPCINTSTVRLRTSDLLEKYLPSVGRQPIWVTLRGDA